MREITRTNLYNLGTVLLVMAVAILVSIAVVKYAQDHVSDRNVHGVGSPPPKF